MLNVRNIMKIIISLCLFFILTSCSSNPFSGQKNLTTITPMRTATPKPNPTTAPTSTAILQPKTPAEIDLDSFVFPFDVAQTISVWKQLDVLPKYQFFTYHINSRNSRDIPYNDPCGYHPGDLIMPIGSFTPYKDFNIEAKLPYSGILNRKWTTQGGDDGFTFFLGTSNGKKVYLNVYHTQKSNLLLDQALEQGDIFGSLNFTSKHGDWCEAPIHLTLFNPAPNGGTDFLGDDINLLDLSSYALPPMMKAVFNNKSKMVLIYEGENWCNMTSSQKIDKLLNETLKKARFCVDEEKVMYCGINQDFFGLNFTQYTYDERSIMLIPASE